MRLLLLTLAVSMVGPLAGAQQARIEQRVFPSPAPDGMRYTLAVPTTGDPDDPRPLVLALHPGGARTPFYGGAFLRQVVGPALRSWNAIIVAPDSPTRSWTTETAEDAVLALVRQLLEDYAVDRDRILVTGFSLGGRGTWFMATRHPDLFRGAIPIAGSPGDARLESLASMPVHVIHSSDDEVVPFAPAQQAAVALAERGGRVRFTQLEGIGHFEMGRYIGALQQAGDWMQQRWAEP